MTKIAEWYRRALQLEEEGLDPGLIGRASRIGRTTSVPTIPEPPSVQVDVQLLNETADDAAARVSPSAIPILSRYAEDFLRVVIVDALRRVFAEHRKVVTKRDVESIQAALTGKASPPLMEESQDLVRVRVRDLLKKHKLSGSSTNVAALSKELEDLVKKVSAGAASRGRKKGEDPEA